MSSIPSFAAAQTGSRQPGASAFGALSAEEFTKVIFSELSRQDPLAPNDTKALLEQLSTIRKIQSDVEQGDRLEKLVTQNEMASAAGLIGRSVAGVSTRNERVEGRVTAVSRTRQGAVLSIEGGHLVLMNNLDRILDARTTNQGPGPTTGHGTQRSTTNPPAPGTSTGVGA
jgi:flagellar hook assembly protein FlgD